MAVQPIDTTIQARSPLLGFDKQGRNATLLLPRQCCSFQGRQNGHSSSPPPNPPTPLPPIVQGGSPRPSYWKKNAAGGSVQAVWKQRWSILFGHQEAQELSLLLACNRTLPPSCTSFMCAMTDFDGILLTGEVTLLTMFINKLVVDSGLMKYVLSPAAQFQKLNSTFLSPVHFLLSFSAFRNFLCFDCLSVLPAHSLAILRNPFQPVPLPAVGTRLDKSWKSTAIYAKNLTNTEMPGVLAGEQSRRLRVLWQIPRFALRLPILHCGTSKSYDICKPSHTTAGQELKAKGVKNGSTLRVHKPACHVHSAHGGALSWLL